MSIGKFFKSLFCSRKDTSKSHKPAPDNVAQASKDIVNLQQQNAVAFGKFSFELEEKRGESLIAHSGYLLTAFSLYSAALLTLLGSLLSNAIVSRTHLFIASTCIAAPLILSLVFTMLAQWRFRYNTLIDGAAFRKEFEQDPKNYCEQYQFDYQFIIQLHKVQVSKKNINNKRLFCIRVAMICFLLSVVILIAFYIYLSVVYTKGV
ncbi:MAG: hypothetical protein J6Q30_00660 [Oscillospiraceae bacterium]|nr:hypothetical protein [Oscillospiraceae bacterium]